MLKLKLWWWKNFRKEKYKSYIALQESIIKNCSKCYYRMIIVNKKEGNIKVKKAICGIDKQLKSIEYLCNSFRKDR